MDPADRTMVRGEPRSLHPVAWWVWATTLAVAASRTTNPVLLVTILAVTGLVVAMRRRPSPWSRSYLVFLRIALIAIVIRVLLFALLGTGSGTHLLFTLPQIPLPHWMAGVRLGGPVSLDGVLYALYDGLRLAVVLVCIGAANSLTSPRRLLKSMPSAWYEIGVALTVALSLAPQGVATVRRLRTARRLRGRPDHGPRSLRGLAVPVLEGALDRSVDLAAAMDARGFGRRDDIPTRRRRMVRVTGLAGMTLLLASTYGLVDRSAPGELGWPLLVAGAGLIGWGLWLGRHRGGRSRYRPDQWSAAEWAVVLTGLVAVVATFATHAGGLSAPTSPPGLPVVPLAPFAGLLVAALPAWLSPPPVAA